MDMNKTSVALLAVLCLGAGAGGAYLASRGEAPASVEESLQPPDLGATVEQSEAVVAEPSGAAAPTPAPVTEPRRAAAPVPAPARRPSPPSAPSQEPAASAPAERVQARAEPPALAPARTPEPEIAAPAEPPAPRFEELVVAAESVIGLQIETAVNSERARVEDQVMAVVMRDVRVGDRVAIPAGARAEGEVTLVERGGKLRDRARLGVRFTSIVLADGTRVAIDTETLFREGDGPGGESAAKIGGGAIGGAIIGGILGGAKGAIIGGTAGAGAGTAAVVAGGRNPAAFPAGTPVTVRITQPATVTVDK
jgi:hypothetical protein